MGVTDGSDALPGRVGEFVTSGYSGGGTGISFVTTGTAMGGNAPSSTRMNTLILPAGDWECSAGLDMTMEAGTTTDSYWQAYLGPLRNNFADSDSGTDTAWFLWHMTMPSGAQVEFTLGVIRISSNAPTTVILQCEIDSTPQGIQCWAGGIIRARRVR